MESIQIDLPDVGPISWATKSGQHLYTSIIPLQSNGDVVIGTIEEQAEVVFSNLQAILTAAGGSLHDVVQVLVFLLNIQDAPKMTAVWERFFSLPYPNRATIATPGFTTPGIGIEIVATAVLSNASQEEESL